MVVVFVAMALDARGSHVGSDGKVGFLAVEKEILEGGKTSWLYTAAQMVTVQRPLGSILPGPRTEGTAEFRTSTTNERKLLFRDQGHLISNAYWFLATKMAMRANTR